MSSQHHLKESLRELGYHPSDNSEIPDIPSSCVSLISTLVDDLLHSHTRITRLEGDIDEESARARELSVQLGSIELTASKIASDNNRLRTMVLEGEVNEDKERYRDEEILELKFLLGEYKTRNRDLMQQVSGESNGRFVSLDGQGVDELKAREATLRHQNEQLQKAIQTRDDEIHHLQNLLGERVVSSNPDTTTRLIYLEEHSRKLEEMLSEKSHSSTFSSIKETQIEMDFTKTTLYETLTAELLAYKRQRDSARDKAARYKSQWRETLEELKLQTSKFELLAQEFRKVIKMEQQIEKSNQRIPRKV